LTTGTKIILILSVFVLYQPLSTICRTESGSAPLPARQGWLNSASPVVRTRRVRKVIKAYLTSPEASLRRWPDKSARRIVRPRGGLQGGRRESSMGTNRLDPGLRRGDDLIRVSLKHPGKTAEPLRVMLDRVTF
jgi:hypothetical protein